MKIISNQWSAHKKSVKIPIPIKCNVNLTIAAIGAIAIYGHSDEHKLLIASAENELHTRPNLEGFNSLEITAKEFGLRISVNGTQVGEHLDDAPPPVKPRPQTLVGRMHARAKETMAVQREAFENNTQRPGYEIDDDEPMEFEEDEAQRLIAEQQQQENENALENQSTRHDPESDPRDPGEELESDG